jgi:phenylalanyl-tRNA synthetase alpha chain
MAVDTVLAEARAAIERAGSTAELETARVAALGRKAPLVQALRELGTLPPAERGPRGKVLNAARQELESLLAGRLEELRARELDERLRSDRVDVTLPGRAVPRGFAHLVERTERDIIDTFVGFGYRVAEGPEAERVFYNFDALNHLPTHPSRDPQMTFYLSDDVLLRTHTSPVQVRVMQAQPPPVFIVSPGRTYRRDTWDPTHGAVFTQVEGLAVDKGLSLAHLKGTLLEFARAIFGAGREVRLRPHFFPFTEPSVEVDVSCFACDRDGSPCRVCRAEGWIEILGAGMVDPNVFGYVDRYDPERVSGFAFGVGIERVAMLKHGVPDLRLFWENDLRFAEQFG